MNARAAMGIIPCGSGNGLARHLKYPTDPRIALKQLNHATPTEIDTLQVNGRTCLNVAGIGFDGYIASEFGQGGRRGLYGYIRTTLGAVTRLKEFHIEYDGYVNQKSSSATMLVITNGSQYGNNAYLNPMADVSDGKFEIIEILCRGPFDAIGLVLRSFNKKLLGSPLVNFHQHVGELNFTLSDFQPYHIDGEPMEQEKKFCLRINPQSLRVLHFPNHSLRL